VLRKSLSSIDLAHRSYNTVSTNALQRDDNNNDVVVVVVVVM